MEVKSILTRMDDVVVVEKGGRKIVRCRLWGSVNTRTRH